MDLTDIGAHVAGVDVLVSAYLLEQVHELWDATNDRGVFSSWLWGLDLTDICASGVNNNNLGVFSFWLWSLDVADLGSHITSVNGCNSGGLEINEVRVAGAHLFLSFN